MCIRLGHDFCLNIQSLPVTEPQLVLFHFTAEWWYNAVENYSELIW